MPRRGSIPDRSNERLGHRTEAELAVTVAPSGTPEEIPQPPPNPDWHPLAKSWYASFGVSGQKIWYEASDWMMLMVAAEQISRELNEKVIGVTVHGAKVYGTSPMSASSIAAVTKIATNALATEADRRRVKAELTRGHAISPEDEVEAARQRREEMKRRAQGA